ncbi:glycosyltransferase family 2 protein [Arenicella xantha]|uniref:Glycosyl transferase family 2 n=1 Tax=Arenicella xantha TaxID=644221 RepID=A0A395JKY2_9GAMM|nr:glycosyltransferase family 2 protein [Arenicella xantha]RBP51422.1 glycosyl transferase family 2 [Arenicella xantha]
MNFAKSTLASAPLVSVVIPVYNVEQYISQALNSVLKQSYQNLEVVVVDDESPDGSIDLIHREFNDPRLRIVRQANTGLAGARNTGIRESKGELIAFLDSDDAWSLDKLQQHVDVMQANPKCGISFSASEFIDEQGRHLGRFQAPLKKHGFEPKDIFCRNPIGNGSAPVIRKDILQMIAYPTGLHKSSAHVPGQYFDESLKQSEDVDCWTRIALITDTQFEFIDKPLTYYRLNNGGLSADVEKQFSTWMFLLRKLETYSPDFAAEYGPVAKAFQYRYLARRCLLQGRAKDALVLMVRAFQTRPVALLTEFRKTIETLGLGLLLVALPQALQLRILNRLI